MSDFHYVNLYAQFTGFRILALANRLGCNDDLSRAAHDRLVGKLDELIALMRRTIAAECELGLDPNGPNAEELGEAIWYTGQKIIYCWSDPEGINLLHNDIIVDWATNELYDCRTGQWRFLDGCPLPRVEVGDDRLNGLCEIVRRIDAETGIRFSTYTTDPSFSDEPEDDDLDWIEDPARNPLWGPDTD